MNNTLSRLHLFGSFHFSPTENLVVNFRGNKARALLAYLALQQGQPVTRQQLTNLLWDGYPVASAKTSLRVTLTNLRQIVTPASLLEGNRQTIQLKMDDATWWCDAVALERILSPEDQRPPADRWAEVQSLYRGEFLAGFEEIDSHPFQVWLQAQRANYRQQLEQLRLMVTMPPNLPNNLERTLTPLIGRQKETRTLHHLLTHPDYPLITVVGEGGVGKTRLALSVAKTFVEQAPTAPALAFAATETLATRNSHPHRVPHFADGIWFVALTDIVATDQVAEQIAIAICSVLRITFHRKESLSTQLLDYLREKAMLLVLDGFERLCEGADFLLRLLQVAPGLKFLITSRQQLRLQAEYLLPLQGLPVSTEEDDISSRDGSNQATQLQALPSVQLFLERARRTAANFRPNQHTYADIAAICRLVDGLPLALELAAAQVAQRPCSEIRRVLAHNSTLLRADLLDLPPRHRSLQLVLADSWQLLSSAEAQVLTQCTLFQGGFTASAAFAISRADGNLLAQLVQKSLLHLHHSQQGERYILHDLVRRYASSSAPQANEPQMRETALRYCHYYLALVQAQELVLQGENPQQAIALIRTELMNIQAAWHWALQAEEWQRAAESSSALADFYQMVGLAQLGETEVAQAVNAAEAALAKPTDGNRRAVAWVLAKFLCARAQLLLALGRDEEAITTAQQVIDQMPIYNLPMIDPGQTHHFLDLIALAYCYLGIARLHLGEPTLARIQLEQALAIQKTSPPVRLKILYELGYWEFSEAHYAEAIVWCEAALAESRTHHCRVAEVKILNRLAGVYHAQNNYPQVSQLMETALQLARQIAASEIEESLLNGLGLTWAMQGDYSLAHHYLTQALAAQRTVGNRLVQTQILCNLGTLMSRVGNYRAAFEFTQQAYQLMQIIGFENGLMTALPNLSFHAHNLGDDQSALRYSQQALQQSQQVQNRNVENIAWNFMGDALMGLGQLAEAAEAYSKAVSLARELANPYKLSENLSGLVRVRQALSGDLTQSMAQVEEILAQLVHLPIEHVEDSFDIYVTCYHILVAQADRRATPLIEQAYHHLQMRAARISDETMRHSFLTQVPAHRELIALVEGADKTKATARQ